MMDGRNMTHPQTPCLTEMQIPKWKEQKKELGVCSFVHNILGAGVCWSFGMRTRTSDK